MCSLNNVEFENITFSKVNNFKTNDGKFCYLNCLNENLIVNFPETTVAFNVNMSFEKPKLLIHTNPQITSFNEKIKELITEYVYNNSKHIYQTQKSKETLSEFYCNPLKTFQIKSKFVDVLQLKMFCESPDLKYNTKVSLSVHVSGVWFSQQSFGPYYSVIGVNVLQSPPKKVKSFLFIEEPESETEINL